MAKTYTVVEVIGDNQFTYQLYNNLSTSVAGTSTVSSELEATGEILIMEGTMLSTFGTEIALLYLDDMTTTGLEILVENEILTFGFYNGTVFYTTGGVTYGNSHYCKMTKTDTEFLCYVDGVLVDTAPYVITNYSLSSGNGVPDAVFGPPEA